MMEHVSELEREVISQAFVWGRDDHRSGYFGDVSEYVGNVFGVVTTDAVRSAYVDGHRSLGGECASDDEVGHALSLGLVTTCQAGSWLGQLARKVSE